MLQFKVGDKAVYPAYGVGQITGIEEREVAGQKHKFYVLKILGNDVTILVPSHNAQRVGMRGVIQQKDVRSVMSILRDREVQIDHQTWNRRYREYMEKIKTGSVFEIAAVIRDLYVLKDDKELSFGERRMLEMARSLLVKELSIARRKHETEIEREIDRIFHC
ncbi:MAG: CarD family transcriptional regulator [Myxococcales bacterium]|nr:MAG: CarD family transcriptional regulator [Myxococcales bacterium]